MSYKTNQQAKENSVNVLHFSWRSGAMLDFKWQQKRLLGKKETSSVEETKPNRTVPAWNLHATWNRWLYFQMQSFELIENTSASLNWSWVAGENTTCWMETPLLSMAVHRRWDAAILRRWYSVENLVREWSKAMSELQTFIKEFYNKLECPISLKMLPGFSSCVLAVCQDGVRTTPGLFTAISPRGGNSFWGKCVVYTTGVVCPVNNNNKN